MTFWTDYRTEKLKECRDNLMSAAQAATEIGDGCTRNAAISKIGRMGLRFEKIHMPTRAERARKAVTSAPPSTSAKRAPNGQATVNWKNTSIMPGNPPPAHPTMPPQAPAEPTEPLTASRVTLMGLTERTCRWPLWGDGDAEKFYCGGEAAHELPFCRFHCGMAYMAPRGRA